jgi:hypothetical protein
VVEVKDKESNLESESNPENIENSQITNAYPTTIVVTVIIQPEEPVDPK